MTWLIVVIAVVVVLAVAAAYRWSRSAALRQRFGPEYERILAQEGGDQRRADAALRDRAKRRAALKVRELAPANHARYGERWHAAQSQFVDDPRAALTVAAQLVRSVMYERGYHADDPDLADGPDAAVYDEIDFVAVDHPEAATRFRAADDAARRHGASTEDLRQAFQGYKALFTAVLVKSEPTTDTTSDTTIGAAADEPDRRVIDVRQRADGDHDGDGDRATGGLLGRFRRQPADPQIR
jgi:hypothetical protein